MSELDLELSLFEMSRKYHLSEEDVVLRFFHNINKNKCKKDFYIKDFESYYFKIRPKFSPKLIRVFLEVSYNNILFYYTL